MPKATGYIKHMNHILLMSLMLFALSPCVVKGGWFGSVNVEYAKSLNKSKATTQANSCQYSRITDQLTSTVKQAKINNRKEPGGFSGDLCFEIRCDKEYSKYSKTSSGSSPPKYILYKRLKLDVA